MSSDLVATNNRDDSFPMDAELCSHLRERAANLFGILPSVSEMLSVNLAHQTAQGTLHRECEYVQQRLQSTLASLESRSESERIIYLLRRIHRAIGLAGINEATDEYFDELPRHRNRRNVQQRSEDEEARQHVGVETGEIMREGASQDDDGFRS
jgi:hypothetical protein